jgi:hypothetical protein
MRAATTDHPRASQAARAVWLVLAALTLILFVAGLPFYAARLQAPCLGPACVPGQLSAETFAALARLGVSARAYATFHLGLNIALTAIASGIGAFVFWRRPGDLAAWTTSLLLVTLPAGNVIQVLPTAQPAWTLPAQFVGWITAANFGLAFYTFPDGRFVPGWTRPLAVGWTALMVLDNFSLSFAARAAQSVLFGLLGASFITSLAVAQVVRFRRLSSPAQRQQTKWVVAGTVLGLGLFVSYTVAGGLIPSLSAPGSLYPAARLLVQIGFQFIVALAIGVAILRYRLWDIDLLINRALVYGALTAALTLVYFGAVLVFQALFSFVSGSGTALATVASTLLLAALFRPLRSRLQSGIDRRFYRRKYNAAQVAAAFGARMRDEVDLDRSTEALVAVVADTLAPRQVWLWLKGARPPRG